MLRTDSPAAPASLMFSGCLWHRWPHNHCWAHRGRGLIFKAFCSDDSLCIHEIDHSGLSVATCAPSPPDLGGGCLQGLSPRRSSGWESEGRCNGNGLIRKLPVAPLWLKLREAQRAMVGEEKRGEKGSGGAASQLSFYCFIQTKYLKIATRSVQKMKR